MSVHVHYQVPLVVEVEPETGEILSVHIVDEQIEGPLRVLDPNGEVLEPQVAKLAAAVAESSSWPGWTAGW